MHLHFYIINAVSIENRKVDDWSVIIRDRGANNLDKLLIVDHSIRFNVGFTEDLIH